MNNKKIALGPGAASLILIVVVLSLCMLAMLTQIGARNDYNLASRSVEMIGRVYDISANSEERLAELDTILVRCQKETSDKEAYLAMIEENLPEGMVIDEDKVTWTEPLDNRTLTCTVRILDPGTMPRTEWIAHKLQVEEPEEDWEWE